MLKRPFLRFGILLSLLILVQPFPGDPSPPYRYASPHASPGQLWLRDLQFAVSAQLPECDCTESKPKVYCPDPIDGPCTSYQCKYTGNNKKKCVQDLPYPPTDPICPGCLKSHNVSCLQPPDCTPGACF